MLGVRDKQQLRRILFSKVTLFILVVLVIVFARATWNVYQTSSFAHENRVTAERELFELEERANVLRSDIAHLETRRGIEEEIRQTFDVGKEGEKLIVLVDAPEIASPPPPAEKTIWERIVSFFGFK